MQLERHVADDLAQAPLDSRVHVLVSQRPREPFHLDLFEHRAQTQHELLRLSGGDDSRLAEHPGVDDRTLYVVRREPDVERDGSVQALKSLRRRRRKPTTPEWSSVS